MRAVVLSILLIDTAAIAAAFVALDPPTAAMVTFGLVVVNLMSAAPVVLGVLTRRNDARAAERRAEAHARHTQPPAAGTNDPVAHRHGPR